MQTQIQFAGYGRVFALSLVMLLTADCGGLAGEPVIVGTLPPRPTQADMTEFMASADLNLGARIFAEHCTACHGETGQGNGTLVLEGQIQAPPDFTTPATVQNISLEEWLAIIRDGRIENMMPPWGNSLSPEELAAVAMYTYRLSSGGAEIAAAPQQPAVTEEAAVTPAAESTVEPDVTGMVHGTLRNGTAGAALSGEIRVALHILDADFNEVDTKLQTVTVSEFTFDSVPLRSDRNCAVTALYQEMLFASDILPCVSGDAPLEFPVTVYEKTADAGVIEITLLLTQVQRMGSQLFVTQIASFHNTSDRAYASANSLDGTTYPSVQLTLPKRARAHLGSMENYALSPDGLTVMDTQPVLPGEQRTMHVSFTLPFNNSAVIEFPVSYRMSNQPELMLPPGQFSVTGSQLQSMGIQQFASGTYDDYVGQPLNAGQSLRFELHAVSTGVNNNLPLAIGLSIAGIGLMVFSAVLYWQNRRMPVPSPAAAPSVQAQIDALIQQIGDLDIRHQQGSIKEKSYKQQRAELKKRLSVLMEHHKPS